MCCDRDTEIVTRIQFNLDGVTRRLRNPFEIQSVGFGR